VILTCGNARRGGFEEVQIERHQRVGQGRSEAELAEFVRSARVHLPVVGEEEGVTSSHGSGDNPRAVLNGDPLGDHPVDGIAEAELSVPVRARGPRVTPPVEEDGVDRAGIRLVLDPRERPRESGGQGHAPRVGIEHPRYFHPLVPPR